MHPPRRPLLLTAATLALLLASCSTGSEPPDDAGGPSADPDASTSAEPDEPEAGSDDADAPEAGSVPECEAAPLESGTVIDGDALADCMTAAMIAAGSGSHVVETSAGTSEVDFSWSPEFSMAVTGDVSFVVRGDEGWVDMNGEWVRGDPGSSDPQEAMAGSLVEAVRAAGDPTVMTSMFRQTDWDVVEEAGVPVTGAVADVAWLLEPQGTMSALGVTLSDVELWIGADHLGVYHVATGTIGDISETTANTFVQWGGPVDIPDPGSS